ncbi:MAG: heavy metal translocating P-type ATPase [Gammaproteobacteria bacterium]|nr:heavy metal translocating P-type ATPase [Gammaproteobacteria bacterium]
MDDSNTHASSCCHPEPKAAPPPAPVHDCCHGAVKAVPVTGPAQDCCHAAATPPAAPAPEHECCHAAGAAVHAAPLARVLRPGEALYVCPMCPGVESPEPGACPKCGMALEPAVPVIAQGEDPELRDMRRRFVVSLALTIPLFLLSMAGMAGWLPPGLGGSASAWLQLLLATPVVLWCGWPLLERGARSIATRNLNMFTLIGLGVAVAYGYSVVATLAPQAVPHAFRHGGQAALYFESAAMIVTLVLLGQVLELRARGRTGAALRALLDLAPKTAQRIGPDGQEREVPLADIRVGDQLRVRPGEKIPVDGIVVEGRGAVDESMVTGESIPVDKAAGAALIGGTLNGPASLVMRAERVGSDTVLARIVQTVAEAQRSRAPVQALADRVSAWFVPAVVLVAVVAAIVWALVGPEPRLANALLVAVSTLIVACPCALGLATPMSMTVAMGRGAQAGVLFRSAESLERLEEIDTLVLDKTGTLTAGRPEVVSVVPVDEIAEAELLRFAASLEQASEHPIAAAVVRFAQSRGLRLGRSYGFKATPGAGATGVVQLRNMAVGNARLMAEAGVDVGSLEPEADRLRALGQTTVFVAMDRVPIGVLGIADPLKPDAWDAVQEFKREGLRVVLLSGDHEASVRAVAQQLGIDEVHAGVLPDEKAAVIRRLRSEGRKVAMAGDGINDAPALAEADVGIAMGAGADIAKQTAGVTLMSGDLRAIGRAMRLSEATMSNIRQNLLFAFGYNSLGVPVAAGVLFPLTGMLLAPAVAAAAMSFSSVSVITNALRLRRVPLAGS